MTLAIEESDGEDATLAMKRHAREGLLSGCESEKSCPQELDGEVWIILTQTVRRTDCWQGSPTTQQSQCYISHYIKRPSSLRHVQCLDYSLVIATVQIQTLSLLRPLMSPQLMIVFVVLVTAEKDVAVGCCCWLSQCPAHPPLQ